MCPPAPGERPYRESRYTERGPDPVATHETWFRRAGARLARAAGWFVTRSALYGCFAGVVPVVATRWQELPPYVISGTYGAVLGRAIGQIVAGGARRPGRAMRQIRLSLAGVLCSALILITVLVASGEVGAGFNLLQWENLLTCAILGVPPAILLGAWAEKSVLRPGRWWWGVRGLAIGALCSVLLFFGIEVALGASWFKNLRWNDWYEPMTFNLEFAWEFPGGLVFLFGPSLLLAACLGFDRSRESAGPRDPGAAAPPISPSTDAVAPSRPPESRGLDTGFHPA